jgi:predicted transcriptional regulator
MSDEYSTDPVTLATELTVAWLGNPNTRAGADDVPDFLKSMFDAVSSLEKPSEQNRAEAAAVEYVPAVTVRRSLGSPEHIISMIDGKAYKTLRRHLNTHGLTPDEYRQRYGLKADYPMVAPAYSNARREMAKKIGLGRKPGQTIMKKPASPQRATKAPARTQPKREAPAKR